jgi:hypothetical protein
LGGCDLGAVIRSRRVPENRSDAFKLQGLVPCIFFVQISAWLRARSAV